MGAADFLKLDVPVVGSLGRHAIAKHAITPNVISKQERREEKKANAETFRNGVWKRDKGRCRATGVKLVKSGTSDAHALGEVDHVIDRSLAPERIYDVSNGILISKYLNRLKKSACPKAPEFRLFEIKGPDDRGEPQEFIWRHEDGAVKKRRVG